MFLAVPPTLKSLIPLPIGMQSHHINPLNGAVLREPRRLTTLLSYRANVACLNDGVHVGHHPEQSVRPSLRIADDPKQYELGCATQPVPGSTAKRIPSKDSPIATLNCSYLH